MYFISSYTMKERDETQKLFFEEHERNLKKQIAYEKEMAFTKRIYYTHLLLPLPTKTIKLYQEKLSFCSQVTQILQSLLAHLIFLMEVHKFLIILWQI